MKKIALVLVLVAVLVVGGVTVMAQGNPSEPIGTNSLEVEGRKLVGIGMLGTSRLEIDGSVFTTSVSTSFWITNPDCVNDITIERLSIIKADGTLIYGGPLEVVIGAIEDGTFDPTIIPERILVPELPPHCQVFINLTDFMPHGGGWLGWIEAQQLPTYPYTVEISYSGEGLDLIGEARCGTYTVTTTEDGTHDERAAQSVPMVNMEQK